ncbi:hypothetical protein JCM11251_001445 [Rhodosporidiobolus azoricus]
MNSHLPFPERTKKRKVRHQYFRSSSLFTPPSPSAFPTTTRPSTAGDTPSAPRWWPSVSRSYGQGQESRFAPKEEEWTGDGEGWVAKLSLRLDSLDISPELEDPSSETSTLYPAGRRHPQSAPSRPVPIRSASSPAWLGQRIPLYEVSPPPAMTEEPKQVELEGPALKQVLLKNLRSRLASEGGTSKAGEAGLRFKKWVVWNSFNRRQRELFSPPSSSEEEYDDDHLYSSDIETDTVADAADEELGFDFGSAIFASPLDGSDKAEAILMQEDFDFSTASGLVGGDDELPTPPQEVSFADDPLAALASEDDSPFIGTTGGLLPAFDLSLSSSSSGYDNGDATPQSSCSGAGVSARPGLRRTTSLPNVPFSSPTSSTAASGATQGGWAAVQASGMAVACEG